jgi:hypothetical protein
MKIKIEFTKSRSGDFERVLGLIRRIKSFSEESEKGITLYSVEFSEADLDSAQAVMDLLRTWKSVVFFMDGKLVPRFKGGHLCVGQDLRRIIKTHEAKPRRDGTWKGACNCEKQSGKPNLPKIFWGNQTPPPQEPRKRKIAGFDSPVSLVFLSIPPFAERFPRQGNTSPEEFWMPGVCRCWAPQRRFGSREFFHAQIARNARQVQPVPQHRPRPGPPKVPELELGHFRRLFSTYSH